MGNSTITNEYKIHQDALRFVDLMMRDVEEIREREHILEEKQHQRRLIEIGIMQDMLTRGVQPKLATQVMNTRRELIKRGIL